jgi:hypothetical protein
MEPINYFQHDYRSRLDKKLLKIRKKHGMAGVGVYWSLVEMLHEGSGFIEMDAETISYELQCDEQIVKDVIELCFDYFEDNVTCNRVIENLKFRREKASAKSKQGTDAVNKRWDKYRASLIQNDTNSIPSVYEPNTQPIPNHTIEKEKEIDKEKDIDKGIVESNSNSNYGVYYKLYKKLTNYETEYREYEDIYFDIQDDIGWDSFFEVLKLSDKEKKLLDEVITIKLR